MIGVACPEQPVPFLETDHPLLYEVNTRVYLGELGQGKRLTLADIPANALDEMRRLNFDLVWLMGVWQTGEAGLHLARNLLSEYRKTLPDLTPEEVLSSPYAVQGYRVARELGGPQALARLRSRLAERGIGLVLDFVPNHTARDHPWIFSHPDFYVQGDEEALRREPENFFRVRTERGIRIIAHGRDPYFPPWTDTAQLNCLNPELRHRLVQTLIEIAGQCDGVRCDMSMLLLRDVFLRLWGDRLQGQRLAAGEFWAEAIDSVRKRYPDFLFIAEVYWGLEAELQALGFDYTYDKPLYDQLLHGTAGAVREHLKRDVEFHRRSVRFLENHDEPRAAQLLPPDKHKAAALICYTLPGMRLFHEGQLDGRKVKVPAQLARRPEERRNPELREFYEKLLAAVGSPVLRHGAWKSLEARPAPEGGGSSEQFVIHRWDAGRRGARVVAVNYGPQEGTCYAPLDLPGLRSRRIALRDLISGLCWECDGDSLRAPGLRLSMAPYEGRLLSLAPCEGTPS